MPDIYFPGSNEPFRPINPWGRTPPKVKQRELPQLWQVFVTRKGKEIPFGPKMPKELADGFFDVVLAGVRTGAHPDLKNPYMAKVGSVHGAKKQVTLRDLIMEKVNAA